MGKYEGPKPVNQWMESPYEMNSSLEEQVMAVSLQRRTKITDGG